MDSALYQKLYNCICPPEKSGGSAVMQSAKIQDLLTDDVVRVLREENEKLKKQLQKKDEIIDELERGEKPKRATRKRDVQTYTYVNLLKAFKTDTGKLFGHPDAKKRAKQDIDDSFYKYDPFESAFDRNQRTGNVKYQEYQKRFIEDWSVSAQKLVILYYGVGSGKTLVALNCAEQFVEITKNSSVYFLLPASLVLNTILEFFKFGVDPRRKDASGDYIYNFVSYQQMLRTNVNFNPRSLLIIDEAHNLRNLKTKEIMEKVSARKFVATGTFSLVGNKLSEILQKNADKFLRTIMMTGTLFVNSSQDLEPLISIGYNKTPYLDIEYEKYKILQADEKAFKTYYEGLISFYRIPSTNPRFPKVKYHFVPVRSSLPDLLPINKDPYYLSSRNDGVEEKVKWVVDFLNNRPNEKTLIYSQFLDLSLRKLMTGLDKAKIKYGFISGELSQSEKMNIVSQYNKDEIRVLLFTLSIKEGISFRETNNIIVFAPYWNYAILEQIIARGIRLTSHDAGNKALVNVYHLVATSNSELDKNGVRVNQWFKDANDVMNADIKKYVKDEKRFAQPLGSRDIDLYNRMFNKQGEINTFEKRLLALPSFENVNNVENNDFIKFYNEEVIKLQDTLGKLPTNKQLIELKRKLYTDFYKDAIKKIEARLGTFDTVRLREKRNPDLVEQVDETKFGDKTEEIKKIISKPKYTLESLFALFGISKKDITQYQAFFTPMDHVQQIIDQSGIQNDKSAEIRVLEPTAGIGNVFRALLKLPNRDNFLMDANELYGPFYQIGRTLFEGVDNIKWYNDDFYTYAQKYNYHYILGNPPFNLRTQIKKIEYREDPADKRKKIEEIKKVDATLYDIDFVAKAYNMLYTGGMLSMIISDRFQRDTSNRFKVFNLYLDEIKRVKGKVIISEVGEFKQADKEATTKAQETKYGMVCITLEKLEDFEMDLENIKRAGKIFDEDAVDELRGNKSLISEVRAVAKQKGFKVNANIREIKGDRDALNNLLDVVKTTDADKLEELVATSKPKAKRRKPRAQLEGKGSGTSKGEKIDVEPVESVVQEVDESDFTPVAPTARPSTPASGEPSRRRTSSVSAFTRPTDIFASNIKATTVSEDVDEYMRTVIDAEFGDINDIKTRTKIIQSFKKFNEKYYPSPEPPLIPQWVFNRKNIPTANDIIKIIYLIAVIKHRGGEPTRKELFQTIVYLSTDVYAPIEQHDYFQKTIAGMPIPW